MWRRFLVACLAAASAAAGATDVNRAEQAALESIKGIGPALSTRILAEREKRPFNDWPDLISRLPGVGPARAALLSAAGLTVNGEPHLGSRAQAR
jgi:competence protein ComEA